MLSRVLRTIREHRLFDPGDRVLCAVSGGPDSLALLHVLHRLAPRLSLTLQVATVDHQLRPEAALVAAEVKTHCGRLGLSCTVLPVDVAAQRKPHVSLQDAARRARLGALQALAQQLGCTRVALGHTADDQAETILFRIVRGTGVAGLAGIPYRRGPFVRPLLDVRRAEVLRHLRALKVSFATDPANLNRRFSRSRVRHDWLPFLAAENPRVVEALLALGQSARQPAWAPPASLPGLPPMGPRLAERLRVLVAAGAGTRSLSVPGGVIEVAYGHARFVPRTQGGDLPPGNLPKNLAKNLATRVPTLAIDGTGTYRWPPDDADPAGSAGQPAPTLLEIALETRSRTPEGPARGAITFAPEALAAGLVLRAPRPGDRMRPRGGRGSRKLQDLLVDAKVPRAARASLPVLATAAGEILFVPGLRPSEHARPAPESPAWVQIRVR